MTLTISFHTVVIGFLFGVGFWIAAALVDGVRKLLTK